MDNDLVKRISLEDQLVGKVVKAGVWDNISKKDPYKKYDYELIIAKAESLAEQAGVVIWVRCEIDGIRKERFSNEKAYMVLSFSQVQQVVDGKPL